MTIVIFVKDKQFVGLQCKGYLFTNQYQYLFQRVAFIYNGNHDLFLESPLTTIFHYLIPGLLYVKYTLKGY